MSEVAVKPPRAFASGVQFTLFGGTMTMPVDLLPAKRSDGTVRLKTVCPACEEGVALSQRYICPEHDDHGPYESSEAHRAIEVDGLLKKLTDEEIEALKQPTIAEKEATFRVFHAADVERETLPNGSVYRVRPKANAALYHLLVDLVSDRTIAFLAEVTLKSSQKLYRLVSRDGLLTLVELIRPGEFHHIEVSSADYDAAMLERLSAFVKGDDEFEGIVEAFDGAEWENTHRERAAALAEAKRHPDAAAPPPIVSKAKTAAADPMAGLAAMLEQHAKPKAKPRKRAAAKRT